jgi:Na+/H+ antiporter NhaD/arsenite permease-like protein
LIGNPQNMLIGQTLQLSFAGYLREAALPVAAGLIATWALIVAQTRGRLASLDEPVAADEPRQEGAPLDRWQTAKGLTAALVIVVCFLFAPWPREVLALSNIVSNVPAVMPLPSAAHSLAGPTLALVNTLAGNLFIANIIVVDAAARAWAFR